jgi:hypothetical protein
MRVFHGVPHGQWMAMMRRVAAASAALAARLAGCGGLVIEPGF